MTNKFWPNWMNRHRVNTDWRRNRLSNPSYARGKTIHFMTRKISGPIRSKHSQSKIISKVKFFLNYRFITRPRRYVAGTIIWRSFLKVTFTVVREQAAIQIRNKILKEMWQGWHSSLNMVSIKGSSILWTDHQISWSRVAALLSSTLLTENKNNWGRTT